MTYSNLLNIIGLVFDLIGVIMLFKYGLPENIDKSGAVYFVTGSKDKDEIQKAKKYERLSYIALTCIIIGFSLQLAANFTPWLIKDKCTNDKTNCHQSYNHKQKESKFPPIKIIRINNKSHFFILTKNVV